MSDNPFLKRHALKGTSSHGKASEQRLAKSMGARLQPNSGAGRGAKSDMKLSTPEFKYRVESKSTIKDTMPLDIGVLTKITMEASQSAEIPAITYSFVKPDGSPRMPRNAEWVLIPLHHFKDLTGA